MPFPFTSQTASKKRPAVIVSSRAYNTAKPDIVLMAVTSQLRPAPILGEVWLQAWNAADSSSPRHQAGLRHPRTDPHHPIPRRPRHPDREALRQAIAQIIG